MVKNPLANAGDLRDTGSDPWVRKILWRRAQQPTLVFLSGKFHGQRRLLGYSPWGCNGVAKSWTQLKQLSMHAHMHFS